MNTCKHLLDDSDGVNDFTTRFLGIPNFRTTPDHRFSDGKEGTTGSAADDK